MLTYSFQYVNPRGSRDNLNMLLKYYLLEAKIHQTTKTVAYTSLLGKTSYFQPFWPKFHSGIYDAKGQENKIYTLSLDRSVGRVAVFRAGGLGFESGSHTIQKV